MEVDTCQVLGLVEGTGGLAGGGAPCTILDSPEEVEETRIKEKRAREITMATGEDGVPRIGQRGADRGAETGA